MRDRVLFAASAVARLVMVVVAFGLAVGSIGLASVRGFCPEVEGSQTQALALAAPAGAADRADPAGAAGAADAVDLATIVEEPAGDAPSVDPDAPAPDPGQTEGPLDQQTPSGEQPTDGATTDEGTQDQAGACPGGVQRCLPPMLSSVLIVGDPICHDQAGGRLRAILVPAFVGSTVLLAGAWWLRPSRLHTRFGSEPAEPRT